MPYDLENITNSTDFLQFAQNTGNLLGSNFFGYFVLLVVFIITFFTLKGKGYPIGSAATVGAWLLTLTAFMLKMMNLIDNTAFWMCVVATPIATFCIFFFGNPD